MKKLLLILLASSLLLASCGGRNNDNTNDMGNNDTVIGDTAGSNNDANTSDNSGNTNDAGNTDNNNGSTNNGDNNNGNTDNGSNNGNTNNGGTNEDGILDEIIPGDNNAAADNNSAAAGSAEIPEGGVSSVTSAEEAVTFIDVNVYSQCTDVLPMSTMSMALPTEDMDTVTYNTGLTDLTGVTDIIVSESMIGSFAYSLVMIRTDGTNTDDIQTALGEQINPRKWVCVGADQIRTVRLDNDIVLVMSDGDRTEPVMNAVLSAAEGVYENIGTVVNVLG